jgi:hypothetical protein
MRVLLLWVLRREVQCILTVVVGNDFQHDPIVVFIPAGVEKEENWGDVIFTKGERSSPRAADRLSGTRKKIKRKHQENADFVSKKGNVKGNLSGSFGPLALA